MWIRIRRSNLFTDWQNKRQKVEVSVLKKEKDSDRVLERAVFALSAKEDITNKDGM